MPSDLLNILSIQFVQYVADGAPDACFGRVQRGHLRRVRTPGVTRVVPRLPLVRRRVQCRYALRLQTTVPGTGFHEHRPQTHSQEILLALKLEKFVCCLCIDVMILF